MFDLDFEVVAERIKVEADLFGGISEEEMMNVLGWYKTGPGELDYARLDDRHPELC